ncbi:hypothetical protein HK104_001631 [Borealophlyctis nickersoniae]|nr:hypothetical protein HK104_001631 [Borealophlyctis nickersoniae]
MSFVKPKLLIRSLAMPARVFISPRQSSAKFSTTTALSYASYNKVILVGVAGRDPRLIDFRQSDDGDTKADSYEESMIRQRSSYLKHGLWRFSMATQRRRCDSSGEWHSEPQWHTIITRRAEGFPGVHTGAKLMVEGELKYWTSDTGGKGVDIDASKGSVTVITSSQRIREEEPYGAGSRLVIDTVDSLPEEVRWN